MSIYIYLSICLSTLTLLSGLIMCVIRIGCFVVPVRNDLIYVRLVLFNLKVIFQSIFRLMYFILDSRGITSKINYPSNSKDLQKTQHLAMCLQPS